MRIVSNSPDLTYNLLKPSKNLTGNLIRLAWYFFPQLGTCLRFEGDSLILARTWLTPISGKHILARIRCEKSVCAPLEFHCNFIEFDYNECKKNKKDFAKNFYIPQYKKGRSITPGTSSSSNNTTSLKFNQSVNYSQPLVFCFFLIFPLLQVYSNFGLSALATMKCL